MNIALSNKLCSYKLIIFLMILCFLTSPAYSKRKMSVSDFVPPVQAESDEQEAELLKINNEDKISVENKNGEQIIKADSAQDAINYAISKKFNNMSGARRITFPSGIGWVSTGVAFYKPMPNPTATLLEQRKAYVVAYTEAKISLADMLKGPESKAADNIREFTQTLTTANEDLTNMKSELSMSNEEIVEDILRGYVVYNISEEDFMNQKKVTVSIVTTPKTFNGIKRSSSDSVNVGSIAEGLDQIFLEIENNIIPPVGGKSIVVPQTGEIAYVGFGTSIVRSSKNPAAMAQNYKSANKIAIQRARSVLLGLLKGDNVKGYTNSSEEQITENKEFDEIVKNDPLDKNNENEIKVFNEAQNRFRNTQVFTNVMSSVRAGKIPEGVEVRTFDNDDHTVVTGIAVYIPSLTAYTKDFKQSMDEAVNEDFSPNKGKNSFKSIPIKARNTGTTKLDDSYITGGETPKSVSGQVSNDSDL